MFRGARRTRITWLLRLSVVAVAVAAYVWMLPSAFGLNQSSGDGGYPYPYESGGNAYGHDRVPICHNGRTIEVAPPAVAAHLAHGDSLGACP
jgi:hypothetical protein